jgi:hypothetical protein
MRGMVTAARIALILVLGVPAGAVAQPPAAIPSIFIVTPGLGVGQWTVDSHLADYVFVMGETVVAETDPSGTDQVFRPQLEEKNWPSTPRIFVVYPAASDTVWAVGTDDPNAKTSDRVGVGSTEAQITAIYQPPQQILELPVRSRTLIYDTRGIAFEFEYAPATAQYSPKAGRVFVFRPGQAHAIWRLP